MLTACHALAQVGITIEAVEREILGWDYYSVISGDATREGIADAGHVPVTFDSLAAYSKVRHAVSKRRGSCGGCAGVRGLCRDTSCRVC